MFNISVNKQYPKVIVRLRGGLGNQLFCYAAAKRLSIKNHVELVIDHISGFSRDYLYKREYELGNFEIEDRLASAAERMEPFGRLRRKLAYHSNIFRPFEARSYIVQHGLGFEDKLLSKEVKSRLYLDGSWQSERYFVDESRLIKKNLKIIPPHDSSNQYFSNLISKTDNAVALHVRWFDPISNTTSKLNISASYYRKAINLMESSLRNPHYFIFSDNQENARMMLKLPDNRFTYVDNNRNAGSACADLWLMTHFRNFILSNSTLNWWGAWFSDNKQLISYPGENSFAIEKDQHECLFSAFSLSGVKID